MDSVRGRVDESSFAHAGGFLVGSCDMRFNLKGLIWSGDGVQGGSPTDNQESTELSKMVLARLLS